MTTGVACSSCARFDRKVRDKEVCDAFPDGIPDEILSSQNFHQRPFFGDHGLQWKPVASAEFLSGRANVIDEGDDADVSIQTFGGKHDQKTHGRKKGGKGGRGAGGGGADDSGGAGGGAKDVEAANIDGVLDGKGVNKQEVIAGAKGKLSKLKTVQTLPNGDELVNHPIPQMSSPPEFSITGLMIAQRGVGLQGVSVSALRSDQQKVVVRGVVSSKIDNIFGDKGPIFVIKSGNEFLIADGHHRATAALLSGKKTIKARVFEPG